MVSLREEYGISRLVGHVVAVLVELREQKIQYGLVSVRTNALNTTLASTFAAVQPVRSLHHNAAMTPRGY